MRLSEGDSTVAAGKMKDVRIIIKNYRLFSEQNPLIFDLRPDFIGLVGSNNSGKSSFLRMFYEFRNLWANMHSQFPSMFHSKWKLGIQHLGISDPQEIFSNTNARPLSIELKIGRSATTTNQRTPFLARVIATCDRASPSNWRFQCFSNENPTKAIKLAPEHRPSRILPTVVKLPGYCDHFDCSGFLEVVKDLVEVLYIGAFRNAINQGAGSYFDLVVGTGFISTWNSWKTGNVKAQNEAIEEVTKDILHIFDLKQLEINASDDRQTLHVYLDNRPYLLYELGSGLTQFIIVFGNATIKNPSFILIDEPELNLHPTLQIDFLTSLATYARKGIIFATHSVGLARSVADEIYSFCREERTSLVRSFQATQNYAEFLGEMSFSSFRDMGYDRVLLVEGVHDVKVVQRFLRMLKKDHKTVILPLGGSQMVRGGVEVELSEVTRLTNKVFALVDSERPEEGAKPSRERLGFEEVCNKSNINVHLTERRAIENYFPEEAIKAELGENYCALEPYERLKNCPTSWDKSINWRIALRMTWDDIRDTDLGKFLQKI